MLSFRANTRFLVGLAAFGAAAMMSAAAAHADAFSDIVSDVQNDLTIGQEDFGSAFSYLSGGTASDDYLSAVYLLTGETNAFVLPGDQVFVGSADALTNQSVYDLPPVNFGLGDFGVPNITVAPVSLAEAATDAQTAITDGQGYLAEAATLFGSGDYGLASVYDVIGTYAVSDLPADLFVLGGLGQLLDVI
jgi:hypothetical protein